MCALTHRPDLCSATATRHGGRRAEQMSQKIRLRVIPDPGAESGRSIIALEGDAMIIGDPGPRQVCGECHQLLVRGIPAVRVVAEDGNPIVIRCPACGAFNEMIPPEALPAG